MGTRLSRYLGAATRLGAGEWSSETASGNDAVCCPASCGQISEIDPARVTATGIVLGIWTCTNDTCPFADYITLGSKADEVLS